MEVYSAFHMTLEESKELAKRVQEETEAVDVSDENLRSFVELFLKHYRETLERFFPNVAPLIPFYAYYPYETKVLRLGPNGVIIGHIPNENASISILRMSDFDPPLTSLNLFDIIERWKAPFCSFDFQGRSYDIKEAEIEATQRALADALSAFWQATDEGVFSQLCIQLLKEEGVSLETEIKTDQLKQVDAVGKVLIQEPAGFRRFERWAFEFKHYTSHRISAKYLRQVEEYLKSNDLTIDIICLITSGNLTSIGNNIVIENPRIRIWDKAVLHSLINKHLSVFEPYFVDYSIAIDTLSRQVEKAVQINPTRFKEFQLKLASCPAGRNHFSEYENIGTEIWRYLFPTELGEPKPQSRTSDNTQRRDVLFRNNRATKFFQRIADRFDADFLIVDFKNYKDQIGPDVIDDVAKYSNKALGRFIIIASRLGAAGIAEAAQIRRFRENNGPLILIVSDSQMLEMIARRERGERPEDVLEDILDEFLYQIKKRIKHNKVKCRV
jgi:restriction endonuclease